MRSFLSAIPVPADVSVLIVSSLITLLALARALLPFGICKKPIGRRRRAAMVTFAIAGLAVITQAVNGLPSKGPQIGPAAVTARFVDPAPPPEGEPPPAVPCRLVITVQAGIPPGDVLAFATQQLGVDQIYFETDDVQAGNEWSGAVTIGSAKSVGDLFKLYAIAVPRGWESYLLKAVNWSRPGDTFWAQSAWPPQTRPATFLTVRQQDAKC